MACVTPSVQGDAAPHRGGSSAVTDSREDKQTTSLLFDLLQPPQLVKHIQPPRQQNKKDTSRVLCKQHGNQQQTGVPSAGADWKSQSGSTQVWRQSSSQQYSHRQDDCHLGWQQQASRQRNMKRSMTPDAPPQKQPSHQQPRREANSLQPQHHQQPCPQDSLPGQRVHQSCQTQHTHLQHPGQGTTTQSALLQLQQQHLRQRHSQPAQEPSQCRPEKENQIPLRRPHVRLKSHAHPQPQYQPQHTHPDTCIRQQTTCMLHTTNGNSIASPSTGRLLQKVHAAEATLHTRQPGTAQQHHLLCHVPTGKTSSTSARTRRKCTRFAASKPSVHLLGLAGTKWCTAIEHDDIDEVLLAKKRMQASGHFNHYDDGAGCMDDVMIGLDGAPDGMAWDGIGYTVMGSRTLH